MNIFPLQPTTLRILLRLTAALGLVAALAGGAVGWVALGQVQTATRESLQLTSDALEALDASAGVASDSIEALGVSLTAVEATAESLDEAFVTGEVLLGEVAGLLRNDVADAVSAVDDALPGLIGVSRTIDDTLRAVSQLPFGPDYDPDQSLSAAFTELGVALDGLPDQLVAQAALVDAAGTTLGDVGTDVASLIAQLASFEEALEDSAELLATYDTTISEGQTLVETSVEQIESGLVWTRAALVLFCVTFALLMIVPLQMASLAGVSGPLEDESSAV